MSVASRRNNSATDERARITTVLHRVDNACFAMSCGNPTNAALSTIQVYTSGPSLLWSNRPDSHIDHIPRRTYIPHPITTAGENHSHSFSNPCELSDVSPPISPFAVSSATNRRGICDFKHRTILDRRADEGVLEEERHTRKCERKGDDMRC